MKRSSLNFDGTTAISFEDDQKSANRDYKEAKDWLWMRAEEMVQLLANNPESFEFKVAPDPEQMLMVPYIHTPEQAKTIIESDDFLPGVPAFYDRFTNLQDAIKAFHEDNGFYPSCVSEFNYWSHSVNHKD